MIDGEPTMVRGARLGHRRRDRHGCRAATDHPVVVTERSMNNGLISVTWNLDGEVISIIDVAHGRQLLPAGKRITLELAPDHPVEYDAWDVESWTRSLGSPITSSPVDPVRDAAPTAGRTGGAPRVRLLVVDPDVHDARRVSATRHPLRHRLARGREAACR